MDLKATAITVARRRLAKRNFHVLWAPESDMPQEFWDLHRRCHEQSMTGPVRLYALHQAVEYIHRRAIPGAIVECGVWRGGSAMMAALTLTQLDAADRSIYLYDTFEGMPEPTDSDVDINGATAASRWADGWCAAPMEVVRANMDSTCYPSYQVTYVDGKVEDTIPDIAPDAIALLRLDTDFYESTLHELEHLYPRLSPGGVLILDDYGNWQGARRAIDEYFADEPLLLNRIDYSGRIAVKP